MDHSSLVENIQHVCWFSVREVIVEIKVCKFKFLAVLKTITSNLNIFHEHRASSWCLTITEASSRIMYFKPAINSFHNVYKCCHNLLMSLLMSLFKCDVNAALFFLGLDFTWLKIIFKMLLESLLYQGFIILWVAFVLMKGKLWVSLRLYLSCIKQMNLKRGWLFTMIIKYIPCDAILPVATSLNLEL